VTGTILWDARARQAVNIAFIIRMATGKRSVDQPWIGVARHADHCRDCKTTGRRWKCPGYLCGAGTKVTADIFGTDPNQDSVRIELFSQVLNDNIDPPFPEPATFTPFPPRDQATLPPAQAKIRFNCKPLVSCERPTLPGVFKITDVPKVGGRQACTVQDLEHSCRGGGTQVEGCSNYSAKAEANLTWIPTPVRRLNSCKCGAA